MTKTIPAVKARQQFGSLLNEVDLTGANIVIERDGKPKAVMIPVKRFRALEKQRAAAFADLTAQAERNQALLDEAGVTTDELLESITEVSKKVRKETATE